MKSYITTPIYYVNGSPHLGHAHTTVMADILKRNRAAIGYDTKLTTGCDEHGQKNQEAAERMGKPVQDYLDERSAEFRGVFDLLGVEYDYFVRTSAAFHKEQVARIAQHLKDKGAIVQKQYSGLYCSGCEQFKKPSDLNEDGRCPDHLNLEVEELDELNYFFQIEPYRQALLAHIEEYPGFVKPRKYANELRKMLAEPLEDLCISRPKTRVSLGVELPFDEEYVTYVWFDALINYISNLNWPDAEFSTWWDTVEHLIGKDILKTHGVYWPIMLMAIDVAPPKTLSVHGHWVGSGGVKMSKTLGNVVDPVEVIDLLGADGLRYFLARNMRTDSDSQISVDLVKQAYASDLSNKLGNLHSRAVKFAKSRLDGNLSRPGKLQPEDVALREAVVSATAGFGEYIEMSEIPNLVQGLIKACEQMNEYFASQAPWDLAKADETKERCSEVLYITLDCLRLVLEAFYPVIPGSSERALGMMGAKKPAKPWKAELDLFPVNPDIGEVEVLFPRV